MRPLHNKLFDRIRALFSSGTKFLEIGAGKITSNNVDTHSHLSRFFLDSDWTFSDIYDPRHAPNANYRKFDLTDDSVGSLESYDCVIGCQVLDTISFDKLSTVVKTIGKLVNPNGYLIHLADLNYFYVSYLNACASGKPNSVLFPGSRPSYDTPFNLLRIDKKVYDGILEDNASDLDEMEKTILKDWGKRSIYTQAKAINICLHTDQSYKSKEIEDRIVEIFGSSIEKISIEDPFENSLKSAAQENGFNVVCCEAIEDTILVDADYFAEKDQVLGGSGNSIDLRNGCLHWSNSDSVPQGKVLLSGNIRVFIAQKKTI